MKGIPTLWSLFEKQEINHTHVAFYFWLRHKADNYGKIVTSIKTLAAEMDMSERTIHSLLDVVEAAQLLRRGDAKGRRLFILEVSTGRENTARFAKKDKSNGGGNSKPLQNETSQIADVQPLQPNRKFGTEQIAEVETQQQENVTENFDTLLLGSDLSSYEDKSLYGEDAATLAGSVTPPSDKTPLTQIDLFASMKATLATAKRRPL